MASGSHRQTVKYSSGPGKGATCVLMTPDIKGFLQKICYKTPASVDMTRYGFISDSKITPVNLLLKPLREKLEKIVGGKTSPDTSKANKKKKMNQSPTRKPKVERTLSKQNTKIQVIKAAPTTVRQILAAPTTKPALQQFLAAPTAKPALQQFLAEPTRKPTAQQFLAAPATKPAVQQFFAAPTTKPAVQQFFAAPTTKPTVQQFLAAPTRKPTAKKILAAPATKPAVQPFMSAPTTKPAMPKPTPAKPITQCVSPIQCREKVKRTVTFEDPDVTRMRLMTPTFKRW